MRAKGGSGGGVKRPGLGAATHQVLSRRETAVLHPSPQATISHTSLETTRRRKGARLLLWCMQ